MEKARLIKLEKKHIVVDEQTQKIINKQIHVLVLERALLEPIFSTYFAKFGIKTFYKRTGGFLYDYYTEKEYYKVEIRHKFLRKFDAGMFKIGHFPVSSTLDVHLHRDLPEVITDVFDGVKRSQVECLELYFFGNRRFLKSNIVLNCVQKSRLRAILFQYLTVKNERFWKLFLSARHIKEITFKQGRIMTDKKVDIGGGFEDASFSILGFDHCGNRSKWAEHPERLEIIISTLGSFQKVENTLKAFFWNEKIETFPIHKVSEMFSKSKLKKTYVESWIQARYKEEP